MPDRTLPCAQPTATANRPLRGVRVISLALNLPGPAALMRLRALGASCLKVEPPAPTGLSSGDPMGQYNADAYDVMHAGIRVRTLDLKTPRGQAALDAELARSDVLLTSFRPSALVKLGLAWTALRRRHPQLSLIEIVGAPAERAEEPGHDLTYLAEAGLVTGTELPPTLFADMGGALMASEAVLAATLVQRSSGRGVRREVALNAAADWLALPRHWGLTAPHGAVGGAHAGYRVYPCKDGRVALAALEPHFARALCAAAGIPLTSYATMMEADTHSAVAAWVAGKTRRQLETLARSQDIPLHTLPKA